MKKIIILVAMLLLGVNSINAARRAVYLFSSIFTAKPSVESTPFGLNYYFEENPSNQQHSNFAIDAQNWIEKHLGISIDGPSSGYTGAIFSLANAGSTVT